MSLKSKLWTDFLGDAANQIEAVYRDLMVKARGLEQADDYTVRRVARTLADEVKRLRDARAAEMALYDRPAGTPGRKTNVGDPNPHSSSGGGKKGRG